jgi:hypothetical protein
MILLSQLIHTISVYSLINISLFSEAGFRADSFIFKEQAFGFNDFLNYTLYFIQLIASLSTFFATFLWVYSVVPLTIFKMSP